MTRKRTIRSGARLPARRASDVCPREIVKGREGLCFVTLLFTGEKLKLRLKKNPLNSKVANYYRYECDTSNSIYTNFSFRRLLENSSFFPLSEIYMNFLSLHTASVFSFTVDRVTLSCDAVTVS